MINIGVKKMSSQSISKREVSKHHDKVCLGSLTSALLEVCFVFLSDSQQPVLSSQGALICHVSFPSQDTGEGCKGKLAVLLLNISAVPWYGLAALWITLWITGRRGVAFGCYRIAHPSPWTAVFTRPAVEWGVLNTEEVEPVSRKGVEFFIITFCFLTRFSRSSW